MTDDLGTQGWLFGDRGEPVARSTDPATSWDAAASVTARTVEIQRGRIVALLAVFPMTDQDIALAYRLRFPGDPWTPSGLRTRRAELVRSGLVVWTGGKRPLATGRLGRVWGLA